jgi:2-keto-4-pentenoate hydratase/2-oxohepta-3-ene-1,7-dioic acid hydratase in catechol pathway
MKIICIGRNYANHAKEMKAEIPTEPLFFMKPDTAILKEKYFFIPDFTKDLHHEVELVIKISKVGKHIAEKNAGNYYTHIGLGIDFTARDIQLECKKNGLPWEKAKAFDNSAVISPLFIHKDELDLNNLSFSFTINDQVKQEGNTNDMLFSFNRIIAEISKYMTLKKGDLIYTGTPEGVGKVKPNDILKGYIGKAEMFKVKVK